MVWLILLIVREADLGSVVDWIAYGYTVQSSKDAKATGQDTRVRAVIMPKKPAPDAKPVSREEYDRLRTEARAARP